MAENLIQRYGTCNTIANCSAAHGVPTWVGFCVADAYMHEPRKTATEAAAFDHMRGIDLPTRLSFYRELQILTDYFSGKGSAFNPI